jgi:NitT/TauT family transport system substrate-binding protein
MTKIAVALFALVALASMPRAATADDTLHVVAGFPGGIEVLENVARYGGLFKAEHLDVDKQYAGGASACAQLAASGKADICATSIEPTILGYDKGVRLQVFLSRVHEYEYVLAVLDDSPIRTLADFKGKDIGEPNAGSTTEVSANDMLSGAGLKKSDYNFVPVGVAAQALTAVSSHRVAGLSTDAVALAGDAAVAHLKFRIFRDPILDSIPNASFEARPDVIANKGDLLKRYARAIVKAALLIRENPQVAARYALMGENIVTGVTPEALAREVSVLNALQNNLAGADPANARIGYTPVSGIALYCQFLYNAGLTSTLVPASAVVTNQFIPYANDFDKNAWIAAVRKMR